MPKGTPTDASRYDGLLLAIDASAAQRLHCSEVARVMGCDGRNVSARLSFALEHGILHRQTEGRSTFYARGPNPNGPLTGLGDFTACLCCDGELHLYNLPEPNDDGSVTVSDAQRRALANVLQGDPDGSSEPVGRRVIEASLWTDGELVLWFLPEPEEDSGAVILSNVERRMLRALLVR